MIFKSVKFYMNSYILKNDYYTKIYQDQPNKDDFCSQYLQDPKSTNLVTIIVARKYYIIIRKFNILICNCCRK